VLGERGPKVGEGRGGGKIGIPQAIGSFFKLTTLLGIIKQFSRKKVEYLESTKQNKWCVH